MRTSRPRSRLLVRAGLGGPAKPEPRVWWRSAREAGAQAKRRSRPLPAAESGSTAVSMRVSGHRSPTSTAVSRRDRTQPFRLGDVWEFPVTNFVDRPPSGWRPLHVCATSLGEMRMVLEHARDHRWYAVVIVLHSFEFVRVESLAARRDVAPQRLLADRFERLCGYLAEHAREYETCHFARRRRIPDSGDATPSPAGVLPPTNGDSPPPKQPRVAGVLKSARGDTGREPRAAPLGAGDVRAELPSRSIPAVADELRALSLRAHHFDLTDDRGEATAALRAPRARRAGDRGRARIRTASRCRR